MDATHIGSAALFLITLAFRNVYELLKKQGRLDTTSKPVFAAVFTSMVVMWLTWFTIGLSARGLLALPTFVRWSGLGLVAGGVFLVVGGMWELRGVENIDHLVTSGLFSRVRHPMYAGFILWFIGWAAFSGAVTSLWLAPLGIASALWWRHLEESELRARYGSAYVEYAASTWV